MGYGTARQGQGCPTTRPVGQARPKWGIRPTPRDQPTDSPDPEPEEALSGPTIPLSHIVWWGDPEYLVADEGSTRPTGRSGR